MIVMTSNRGAVTDVVGNLLQLIRALCYTVSTCDDTRRNLDVM